MFCEHCGKSLSENQAFCENCGTPAVKLPKAPVQSRKFQCPHCGSVDLYPITSTETTISSTGGGYSAGKGCLGLLLLGPFGLLCGSCGSKTKTDVQNSTKNYWVCRTCGKKFLDIDNLNALLEQEKANLSNISFRFFFIIVLVLFLGILILKALEVASRSSKPILLICLIVLAASPFIVLAQRSASKQRCAELEQEKAFLEQYAYGDQNAAR